MHVVSSQQLPEDIHNTTMSPAQQKLSSKFSNTQVTSARKLQTAARDTGKLSTNRSSSRGANIRGDFRQLRTAGRDPINDSAFSRMDSRNSIDREIEESKEIINSV